MRTLCLCLLAVLLSGCTDTLDFGLGCSAQMTGVRRREGRSPDDVQRSDVAGNHVEKWYYFSGSQTRVYTFRWGTSTETCEVSGPSSSALIPLTG